jgi:phenylacetic acid degradation operon negative regulatory protein
MPVSALVEAAALFGIEANAQRVAVARLLASGQIARDLRGHYRIGAAAAPVDRRVLGWRRAEDATARWQGGWWLVRGGRLPPARAPGRRRRGQALRLLGFAPLARDLALRPDNLRAELGPLRAELALLGLEPDALLVRASELDPDADARARGLWSRDDLERGYRRSLAALAASEARLARLPEAKAMVESFLLGGRVIRQLVLDPLLPEPLAPEALRRDLALVALEVRDPFADVRDVAELLVDLRDVDRGDVALGGRDGIRRTRRRVVLRRTRGREQCDERGAAHHDAAAGRAARSARLTKTGTTARR